jgi:hypothetical protein
VDYEKELGIINESLAPKNADELFIGMHLAFFLDYLEGDGATAVMRESAEAALAYWRDKYDEEIRMLGESNEESINGNGQ